MRLGHILRDLHRDLEDQIASASAIYVGNTLAAERKGRSRLCAFGNCELLRAFQCGNLDFRTQSSFRIGDGLFQIQIVAVTLKYGMGTYGNDDIQIAGTAAAEKVNNVEVVKVSYTVVITDASGAEVKNESNIGTTTYAFDFASYPAGEYTVAVTAVGTDSSKNSVAAVRSYANKTLDRVTDFTVINGILVYNSVEGAEKYYVTVDCGNPAHKHTMFDNGSSTVFSILNCTMQKGGIKITVTASAKGYASSVSKTFVYEK